MKHIFLTLFTFLTFTPLFSAKTSLNGIKLIKSLESLSLIAYPDGNSYSIGYGHHSNVSPSQRISKSQAEKYFLEDLKIAEQSANRLLIPVKIPLSQPIYDTIVSLIFNCGSWGFQQTTFYKKLLLCRNKKDLDYTLTFIKNIKGSKNRRLKEYKNTLQ